MSQNLRQPLKDIKVIDLSRVLAGPYCCVLLSFLGADVIKVESHGGDEGRTWPPHKGDMGASFLALNANKRSIALDLKTPAGVAVLKDLARTADVVVENFKTGDMARFGLGYEVLSAINPKLIYASITAFGPIGPKARDPGYEALVQAYSGVMGITGEPGGKPVRCGVSFLDMGTGTMTALAIATALFQRESTGRGTKIDASLLGTATGLMANSLANYLQHGIYPDRMGTAHPQLCPYQAFPTADGHVFIAAGNQNLFTRLCNAIGLDALLHDPRYTSNALRVTNRDACIEAISASLGRWDTEPLMAVLAEHGIPFSRINDFDTLWADGQIDALGVVENGFDPDYGSFRIPALPFHFEGLARGRQQTAPRIGEHTRAILSELGYSSERIAALIRDNIIHTQ